MIRDTVSAEVVINGIANEAKPEHFFSAETVSSAWNKGDLISKHGSTRTHPQSGCSIRLHMSGSQDDPFLFDQIADSFYAIFDSLVTLKTASPDEFELQLAICIRIGNGVAPALGFPAKLVNLISSLNGSIDVDLLMD